MTASAELMNTSTPHIFTFMCAKKWSVFPSQRVSTHVYLIMFYQALEKKRPLFLAYFLKIFDTQHLMCLLLLLLLVTGISLFIH